MHSGARRPTRGEENQKASGEAREIGVPQDKMCKEGAGHHGRSNFEGQPQVSIF
jgi:hypothetical protein